MLSHFISNGLVFGAVTPHDAAWLLIFVDLMAACTLVKFWDAAGRIGFSRPGDKPPHDKTPKPQDR